jgi:hypothetical protein
LLVAGVQKPFVTEQLDGLLEFFFVALLNVLNQLLRDWSMHWVSTDWVDVERLEKVFDFHDPAFTFLVAQYFFMRAEASDLLSSLHVQPLVFFSLGGMQAICATIDEREFSSERIFFSRKSIRALMMLFSFDEINMMRP